VSWLGVCVDSVMGLGGRMKDLGLGCGRETDNPGACTQDFHHLRGRRVAAPTTNTSNREHDLSCSSLLPLDLPALFPEHIEQCQATHAHSLAHVGDVRFVWNPGRALAGHHSETASLRHGHHKGVSPRAIPSGVDETGCS
jgi:hypothetical protein